MKKQRVILYIVTFLMMMFSVNEALCVPAVSQKESDIPTPVQYEEETEQADIIKRVGLKDKFRRSPESQINSFFKKYNKYASNNKIEKLKELYSSDYVNNDGFDKETIFKMMKLASEQYKEISYQTDILSIKVAGNNATVKLHELSKGETASESGRVKGTGIIESDIYYTDYLKKEGNQWKLSSSIIETETVQLKYGEAKNMVAEITAPDYVGEDTKYEITLNTETPDGAFVVGSIVNEQIVFPQVSEKDVFRSIKSDMLARIVTSNKSGNNEYATVSIALTRPEVKDESVVLGMSGIAFIMKRVNVLPKKENVVLGVVKKEVKGAK